MRSFDCTLGSLWVRFLEPQSRSESRRADSGSQSEVSCGTVDDRRAVPQETFWEVRAKCSEARLAGWMVGWLAGWLIGLVKRIWHRQLAAGWLAGWLAGYQ